MADKSSEKVDIVSTLIAWPIQVLGLLVYVVGMLLADYIAEVLAWPFKTVGFYICVIGLFITGRRWVC